MDHPHFSFWHHLRQSGLLPAEWIVDRRYLATGVNLVPLLREAWRFAQPGLPQTPLTRRLQQILSGDRPPPMDVSRGLPAPAGDRVRRWIGERLVWWPTGIPARRWVGIVSSRLPRSRHEQRHWFTALRGACELAQADGETLIFASKTTTARFLERCGQLYQIPTLRFELARESQSFERWLKCCLERPPLPEGDNQQRVAFVSPPIGPGPTSEMPTRDTLIVAASDRLVALHVRHHGHISQLLTRRLGESSSPTPDVELTFGSRLVSMATASQLRKLGAQSLCLVASPETSTAPMLPVPIGIVKHAPLLRIDEIPADRLLHWTRQQKGPWPDESTEQYLDALLFQQPTVDHSALASLRRIAEQQCLWATSTTIRGGTPVVCFTSISTQELLEKRAFRAHRGRWDFELFGISIDRQWLQEMGAPTGAVRRRSTLARVVRARSAILPAAGDARSPPN